jgi:carotenoid cleavage dioxygenase-like enzyme
MSYDAEAYEGCFESAAQEWHSELTPTAGVIPADLEGTLFSVGPGRFDVNGQRFKVRYCVYNTANYSL